MEAALLGWTQTHLLSLFWSGESAHLFAVFFAYLTLRSLSVFCLSLQLKVQPDYLGAGCATAAATFVERCASRSTETVAYSRMDASFMQLSQQNRSGYLLTDPLAERSLLGC